jgi:hypothetical protein
VVQFCCIAELDGLRVANRQGEVPLVDLDPAQPNDTYFRHVDFCVETLNGLGLVACLLPTWGDKVHQLWGDGPVVFDEENARAYGRFLGGRYAGAGVVWMLGGDRPAPEARHKAVWHAMAAGLIEGHLGPEPRPLITYHPPGGSGSFEHIGDPDWLDFHCIQSGHTVHEPPADTRAVALLQSELARHTKPVLEAEPLYEAHPKFAPGWQHHHGHSTADEVLAIMKQALDHGACGVTYGCHAVWQWYDPMRNTPPVNQPVVSWQESLRLPGAERVGELKAAR